MASKINGWLRQRIRANGMTWLWCYQRLRPGDGKMVENFFPLGLLTEIGDEAAAWRRVGELGLVEKYKTQILSGKPTFGELCAAYVKDGLPFRKKDGRRKSKGTIETYQYHIDNIILPRWRNNIAEEMKPLAIRNWLYDLHDGDDYRWETCSKTAGIMSLMFDFVDHSEIFSIRNPMDKVTIPASEEEHPAIRLLSPEEVFSLMEKLPSPVSIAVLLVAATGLRVSGFLALRWRHVLWDKSKISIEQVFRQGEIFNRTKTKASKAPVPMCEALATTLTEFRQQTEYSNDEDFIFASAALRGKQPLWGQTLNAKFVKPAAIELRLADESEHFGWHRFRHSLSTWANETTKDITVSQTMLRHAKPDTTAIYTHGNFGKALDAQRVYMEQLLRMKPASESTQ
jgi:site-specific recombinase XerD